MAGVKELNDVSSAILYMDTLAVDSMDFRLEALPYVEPPAVLAGAQSVGAMSTDSCTRERTSQGRDNTHEIEYRFGSEDQGMEFSGAKQSNHDVDEDLVKDPGALDTHGIPGTLQEVLGEDAHELIISKGVTENNLELETRYDDEGSDPSAPDTPDTPQKELLQDAQELDEIEAINGDEDENTLEVERGSDDVIVDLKSGSPQVESPDDFNPPDEMNDMNVDGPENEIEVLGDGEGGEKSLDSGKFVAPFPISRVKRIIKLDKDVRLVTSDAIALVAQATALFVQSLSSASFTVMVRNKRKTIRGPDVVLAAQSTRQFRECLGNDLATLLEEPNADTAHGEDGPGEKDHGTSDESLKTRRLHQKSTKKHQLAAPPGSTPITNFFKV